MADVCSPGSRIGGGSYSNVYHVTDSDIVTKVYFKPQPDIDPTDITSTSEIDILFRLRSPYLIEGRGIIPKGECKDFTGPAVQMDYSTGRGRTLSRGVSYDLLKRVLLHYALGLRCLHRKNYLHLDIAESNCLYRGKVDAPIGVLIDYGLSAAIERDEKNQVIPLKTGHLRITITNRPVENINDPFTYSSYSDIWSLGMIYLEFLSKRNLYTELLYIYNTHIKKPNVPQPSNDDTKIQRAVALLTEPKFIRGNLELFLAPIPRQEHTNSMDLLVHMLDRDTKTRWSIEQVIDSPYFADMKEDVKALTGDQCDEVEVFPTQAAEPFGSKHLDGLKAVIAMITSDWSNFPLEFFFNALDVYMRVVAGVGPATSYKEFSDLATISVLIAHRLYKTASEIPEKYKGKVDAIQYDEKVLKQLSGIIRRPYLYDMCHSMEEAGYVYNQIFASDDLDTLSSYLRIDLTNYIKQVREEVKGATYKVTTVKTFLAKLPSQAAEKKEIERLLAARDEVYSNMIQTLIAFTGAPASLFMKAFDVFLRNLPLTNEKIYENSLAAIITAYLFTYKQEPGSPYSRGEHPQVYESVDQLIKTSYNPFYDAATSMDELRAFYKTYLLPQEGGHFTAFNTYSTLDPVTTMTELRKSHPPTADKTGTITEMFGPLQAKKT